MVALGLALLSAGTFGCDIVTGPQDAGPQDAGPQDAGMVEPVTFGQTSVEKVANSASQGSIFVSLEPGEQLEVFATRNCAGEGQLLARQSNGGATITFTLFIGQKGVIDYSARRVAADGSRSICSNRNAEVLLGADGGFLSAGTLLTGTPVMDGISTGALAVLLPETGTALWVTDGVTGQSLPLGFRAATLEGSAQGEAYALAADAGALWAVKLDGGGAVPVSEGLHSAAPFFEVGGEVLFRGCRDAACSLLRRATGNAVSVPLDANGTLFDPRSCHVHQSELYCTTRHPAAGVELWKYDTSAGLMTQVTDFPGDGGGFEEWELTSAGSELLFVPDPSVSGGNSQVLWALQADGGVTTLDAGPELTRISLLEWGEAGVMMAFTADEGRTLIVDGGAFTEVATVPLGARPLGVWHDELIWTEFMGPTGTPAPTWRLNLISGETTPGPTAPWWLPTAMGEYFVTPTNEGAFNFGHYSLVSYLVVDLASDRARTAHRVGLFSSSTGPLLAGDRLVFGESRGPDTGVLSVGPQELADLFSPTITCPGNKTVPRQTYLTGEVVHYDGADAGDTEGPVRIWYSQDPGFFPLGATTVAVHAVDLGGNTAECTFSVTVE